MALTTRTPNSFSEAVRAGLLSVPKQLPPWLLYDTEGSGLFEEITRLPEYYVTRTEHAILSEHAADIVEAAGVPDVIVELGAGSATKTALVLREAVARNRQVTFFPVDVSQTALDMAVAHLRDAVPSLRVHPVLGRYPEELTWVADTRGRRSVLFLGSNIGNYDPSEGCALLAAVRGQLSRGDTLVLGVDRRKDASILVPAYDDAAGVTAAFTLNVLARINRELQGQFDLAAFRHVAVWNAQQSRIELYLESLRDQSVDIGALRTSIRCAAGERVHVENSYKLTPEQIRAMLAEAGFARIGGWSDAREWFSVEVARAV